jgi:F-type H+-transporting ATPase subunit delta
MMEPTMAERAIARRYAQAFVELAEETSSLDTLTAELSKAQGAFHANEAQLGSFLANPVFTVDERRKVLQAVMPKLGLTQLTNNLLNLLVDNNRMGLFDELVDIFGELADVKAGRIRVLVKTAEPLSPQLEAEVRSALETATGKQIRLRAEIDSALIGGMTARIGSKLYDASVRTRLEEVRQRLLSANATAEA